ncbi:hypothetical protein REPUB_Repub07fG0163000 [Reevesia pubescens]
MDGVEELNKMERKKNRQKWHERISFLVTLPGDVSDVFAGIRDWNAMEELIYCYIALNSPEVHQVIVNAFLSLCCS